jgi:hypothetical protein
MEKKNGNGEITMLSIKEPIFSRPAVYTKKKATRKSRVLTGNTVTMTIIIMSHRPDGRKGKMHTGTARQLLGCCRVAK